MMLREIAAAVLLLAATPVLAQQGSAPDSGTAQDSADSAAKAKDKAKKDKAKKDKAKKDKKKAAQKADDKGLIVVDTDVMPPPPVVTRAAAPAPVSTAPLAPPAPAPITKVDDNALSLSTAVPLSELPLPNAFDSIDAKVLKDVALCIFPFVREDKAGSSKEAGENLERIQKIFLDVAKSSPLLKDAIPLGTKNAPLCDIEDVPCISGLGGFTSCTTVLVARATREDNGFTLRARLIDAEKGKLIAKVNQVVATDDESEMAAWAEGQACRALKVNCKAQVMLDADRPDIKLMIDNKVYDRKPSAVPGVLEPITLMPGLYKVRASIGQRNSREVTLAVRRNQSDTIYARQTADGGIPLILKSELKSPVDMPAPSKDFVSTKPTKIVGAVAAGLGVIAEGFAVQQYLHSQSLANGAANDYTANGYYKSADLNAISSAKTAHTNSTIFTAVGAGLIVVGGVLFFAF